MIRFPRRLRLGFRPWYGLTLRQLFYLLIAAVIAGGIVLTGSGEGLDLILRVAIGLFLILLGAALAFYRPGGLSLERWLFANIQFWRNPQLRVWTRGGGRSIHAPDATLEEQPRAPRTPAPKAPAAVPRPARGEVALSKDREQAFVVILDLFMLLSLLAFTVYLQKSGLADIQGWLSLVSGR
jgi:PrgI family protein